MKRPIDLSEEGDAARGTRRGADVPAASRAAVVAPSLAAARAASVEPVTRDAVDTTRVDTPAVTRDAVPAERDATPTRRMPVDVMAALGDDALEPDEIPEEAPADPRALKVRGWAGRGPVGLTVIKPPRWMRDGPTRRGPGWALWWALTGAELDGKPRTNATWFRFGTKAYARSDKLPPKWSAWPRAARMLARYAGALVVAALVYAYLVAPTLTAWMLGLLTWAFIAAAGWTAATSGIAYRHRRQWVQPTAQALAPVLGYPERTPVRRYLFIPVGFAQAGGQVEVALPPDFVSDGSDEMGKKIVAVLRRKLALNTVSESWHLGGRNHFVILRTKTVKRVPALVPASNPVVMDLIDAQPPAAPLIGLGAGGVPISVNLDNDSPHALASIGSGGGKSEVTKGMLAQLLHNGSRATIVDFKYTSHEWARGLPSVRIARSIEAIHLALVAMGAEGDRRNQEAERCAAAGEKPPFFQRWVLLVEEANATVKLLQLWWQTHRQTLMDEFGDYDDEGRVNYDSVVGRYGDPRWAQSPATVALLQLMSMGRQRRMHVIMVAQHATSNSLGGPEIREQFAARIIGRASPKAWPMLAADIAHPPTCSWHRGRMYLVREGAVHELQAVLWGDEEARAWASAVEGDVLGVPGVLGPVSLGSPGGHVPTTPSRDTNLVTLAQAHEAGIFSRSLGAVKRASSRDPEFPKPVVVAEVRGQAHKYDLHDLRIYESNRRANKEEVTA